MRDKGTVISAEDSAPKRRAGWNCRLLTRPDGHHIRIAGWGAEPPAAARGSVLLLTGRNETLEKYEEQAEDWCRRGWRVVGMDWRGQGGSSRYLDNRHKGHVPDFQVFLDDLGAGLEALLPPGSARPVIAFAHSMGGHVLMRYLAEQAAAGRDHPVTAAILSAPMLGIYTGAVPAGLLRRIAARLVARGRGDAYVPGQTDWSPADPAFARNLLTGDPERFLIGHRAYAADPNLAQGGITWGWLDAAFRSMDRLETPGLAEGMTVPVLILTGGRDRIVRNDRHAAMARRLPRGRQRHHPDARHELMMEADPIRNAVWADIDAYLAEVLPRPVEPGTQMPQ
ncbi:MAG: lysophospholipase [Pseudomonadota bacterium]|jgi:lysophospholipase